MDGLEFNDCFGAGICGPMYNYRGITPMGILSTIFSAEVIAGMRSAGHLMVKNLMMRRIYICSNSRAAVAALAKTATKSALVWGCVQALRKLSEYNKVTALWIPRHQGIQG
jgi:hypothetical protein